MPRFAIKDLFLATTLIAFGTGTVVCTLQPWCRAWLESLGRDSTAVFALMWLGGGAFIGAGLFTPFRLPWIGVVLGIAAQIAWPVVFVLSR